MAGQKQELATGPWRQYVTSDTLQAVDLQGKSHVVVIDRVVRARMSDRNDPTKEKGVLNVYFKGKRKPLVVKAELSGVLTRLAGSNECARWVGMAIEIYPGKRFAFGVNHDVVYISPKRPTADQAKVAGARPPEPEMPATDLEEDEIREGGPPAAAATGPMTADEMREALERERKEHGGG